MMLNSGGGDLPSSAQEAEFVSSCNVASPDVLTTQPQEHLTIVTPLVCRGKGMVRGSIHLHKGQYLTEVPKLAASAKIRDE
jgi:hypothetical protein